MTNEQDAGPSNEQIGEMVRALPYGMVVVIARDVGETTNTIQDTIQGQLVKRNVDEKIYRWLMRMGTIEKKPSILENQHAAIARNLLLERLVPMPTSAVLIDTILHDLRTRYAMSVYRVPLRRWVAIIEATFPVEIHTDGLSVIGYRLLNPSEGAQL